MSPPQGKGHRQKPQSAGTSPTTQETGVDILEYEEDTRPGQRMSLEDAASATMLPVRCKITNAEFYKDKFGSGNKGKCIKLGSDWFTPTEFEAHCGRGSSKDWKRSIRFGGRTLQTLIQKGFLVPHAMSCICSICVDDASASAPVRHFTPYQRKRKYVAGERDDGHKQTNNKVMKMEDGSSDASSNPSMSTTALDSSFGSLADSLLKVSQVTLPPATKEAWQTVEEAVDGIFSAAVNLKAYLKEIKERTNQEAEQLKVQLQNSIIGSTLIQNQVVGASESQVVRVFDSNRIQTYTIELVTPDNYKPSGTPQTICVSKCENCGRDGSLECSGCQGVRYCSAFCQRKDWPTHQMFCRDSRKSPIKAEPSA